MGSSSDGLMLQVVERGDVGLEEEADGVGGHLAVLPDEGFGDAAHFLKSVLLYQELEAFRIT